MDRCLNPECNRENTVLQCEVIELVHYIGPYDITLSSDGDEYIPFQSINNHKHRKVLIYKCQICYATFLRVQKWTDIQEFYETHMEADGDWVELPDFESYTSLKYMPPTETWVSCGSYAVESCKIFSDSRPDPTAQKVKDKEPRLKQKDIKLDCAYCGALTPHAALKVSRRIELEGAEPSRLLILQCSRCKRTRYCVVFLASEGTEVKVTGFKIDDGDGKTDLYFLPNDLRELWMALNSLSVKDHMDRGTNLLAWAGLRTFITMAWIELLKPSREEMESVSIKGQCDALVHKFGSDHPTLKPNFDALRENANKVIHQGLRLAKEHFHSDMGWIHDLCTLAFSRGLDDIWP